MINQPLTVLVNRLISLPSECEWVEFKQNFHSGEEIGKNVSALANTARLKGQDEAYILFGIDDKSHSITGTTFSAQQQKVGNEELENWLINRLSPKIDFVIHEADIDGKTVVLFRIPSAKQQPVTFLKQAYVRVGTATRPLADFPEKAARIWQSEQSIAKTIVKDNLTAADVIQLLATADYFELLKLPYPTTQVAVLDKLVNEGLVVLNHHYAITHLGAILFAKDLTQFELLSRKAIRVIVYKGTNKIETEREFISNKGYAIAFPEVVEWINSQLPANEEIGQALRNNVRIYPEIAIRELVANALIHQDFSVKGFPMVEIYRDRIDISNAGLPSIPAERFIDGYQSRNEQLADLMRRMRFCEEKGSGMDKVIFHNELYQLPPINIILGEQRTQVLLYHYRPLNALNKKEKIRACYQHACLKYVSNDKLTNQSLRTRFQIEDKNYSIASRIIKLTVEEGLIKDDEPENKSKKYAGYIPFWA